MTSEVAVAKAFLSQLGHENLVMLARILGALLIGAAIGLERTFHGRPAGFRTHALVCAASSLLMLVTVYQNEWMTQVTPDAIRTDPTRMTQGIMTGIGFLGAAYPWVLAAHVIFVIFLMASLFMIPRYFIYHHQTEPVLQRRQQVEIEDAGHLVVGYHVNLLGVHVGRPTS